MIYFDNAATTMLKPPKVAQAVTCAIESFGGVGRGVHGASLDAGTTVFQARQKLSDLFGAPGAKQVAFTSNATEALKLSPTNKWDLLVMGRLMLEIRKDREAAEKYFERALQFHPGDKNVLKFIDRVFAGEME